MHCLPRLLTRPQAHPHEEVWCPSFLKRGRDTCENVFGQSARRLAKGCRCAHRKVCDHFGGRAATSGGASFDTSRIVSPMVECAHRFQALRPGDDGRAVDKEKIILRHIRIRPPQRLDPPSLTLRLRSGFSYGEPVGVARQVGFRLSIPCLSSRQRGGCMAKCVFRQSCSRTLMRKLD